MTAQEFDDYIAQLRSHDWNYMYSDDSRVWHKGKESHTDLLDKAKLNPVYKRAYSIWSDCENSSRNMTLRRHFRDMSIAELRQETFH